MERVFQSTTRSALTQRKARNDGGNDGESAPPAALPKFVPPETPDLGARVIYFPVRHHSPACAYHVEKLIRQVRPAAVLIEGPRDATPLIPMLLHPETKCPVAIYTTYVERTADALPRRHAAYYPLCSYSPELAALQAAAEVGATARFIDLTYPEMVRAGRTSESDKAQSLFDERALSHSRFLQALCGRCGTRNPDELWDHLYEVDYESMPTAQFMHGVLTYCALARHGDTADALEADGTLAREHAMAAAIKREDAKRIVVVTGGFHSVALPKTKPRILRKVDVAKKDALVVLMRYGFEQLDRLNGYASGMPSPAFYQHLWDNRDIAGLFVELGRRCRKRRIELSVAEEIGALEHCRRLAELRGHTRPAREDALDAIRSCFVKGAIDIEGIMVLAIARQLLAGDAVGDIPPDAGQPPIVEDFRATAQRLKVGLDLVVARESVLDLYRKARHRALSRFFYRLRFLDVPFAELVRGPDFVGGKDLDRIQEVWRYHWSPAAESTLIEQSVYGASIEEAVAALLQERFAEAEAQGQGRRADVATALLLEACRMGLHRHTRELLERTRALIAQDADFVSLVTAIETLLALHVSREPLEAHNLTDVTALAEQAYERAVYLLPQLTATAEEQTEAVLNALNALAQSATTLGDTTVRRELRHSALREVINSVGGNAAIRGAAAGTLHGDGELAAEEVIRHLRGHLVGTNTSDGPAFLRGLMRTARSLFRQLPEATDAVHEVLRSWPEEQFVRQVPDLRLAFADLTPRECNELSATVADRIGVKPDRVPETAQFSERDLLLALDLEARLKQTLKRDGLGGLTAAGGAE